MHDPRVLHGKGRAGASTLVEQWDMVLQCMARFSQVKGLTSAGLAAIGRDYLAYGWSAAGS